MGRKYDDKEVHNLFFTDGRKPSTEYDEENKFAPINVDREGNKVKMVRFSQIQQKIDRQINEEETEDEDTGSYIPAHHEAIEVASLYEETLDPESAYIAAEERRQREAEIMAERKQDARTAKRIDRQEQSK